MSILKNNNDRKLSSSAKDDNSDASNTANEAKHSNANLLSVDTKKRKKITNMRVEEDQANLSDLGAGPDRPQVKTIYK